MIAPAALAFALALAAPTAERASPAPALPRAEEAPAEEVTVRDRVRALLGTLHGPVPVDRLRELGPEGVSALAELAVTPGSNVQRVRALDALAALGGPRAEEVHREVLAHHGEPRAVRRVAVRGLGQLTGPSRAAAALAPYLEDDPDPTVRATAAEAIAAQAPDACDRVRARARLEREPTRFAEALGTCDRAGAPSRGRIAPRTEGR